MIGDIIFVLAVGAIAFCFCHKSVETTRTASNEKIKLKELDYKRELDFRRADVEFKQLEYTHKLELRRLEIEEWKNQLDFHKAIVIAQIEKGISFSVLYKPPLPVNAQLLRTHPPPYAG